jgi:CHAT domain-containing protein/tetratricopeptide (TPR) repeat protein
MKHLAAAVLLCAVSVHAAAQQHAIERKIADSFGGATATRFTIDVPADTAVRALVRRQNVYLQLRLLSAGQFLGAIDDLNGTSGLSMMAMPIRSAPMQYELELDPSAQHVCGTYELFLEREPADATSRAIVDAQRRLFDAMRAERAGDAPSVRGSLQLYEETRELGMRSGDLLAAGIALYRSSAVYGTLGQTAESSAQLERVLPLFREMQMSGAESRAMGRLGENARRVGDVKNAERLFTEALPLSRLTGDRAGEADILNNMGLLFTEMGRWDEATALLAEAIPLAESSSTGDVLMSLHHNVGYAYAQIGDYTRALEAYARSLAMKRAAKETPRRIGRTAMAMAQSYVGMGDYANARTSLDEAFALFEKAGDPQSIGVAAMTRARLQLLTGDSASAVLSAKKSEEVLRQVNDKRGEGAALALLGEVDVREHRIDAATERLQRAITLAHDGGDRRTEADALYWLGRNLQQAGRIDEAIVHARAAVDVVESMRQSITDPEVRSTYLGTLRHYFDLLIDLLMRKQEQAPDGGFADEAFRVNERARARMLLESLARSSADVRKGIPPELHERERSLRRQITGREAYRARLLRGDRTQPELLDVESIIENLRAEYRTVESAIRASSPEYAALALPQPIALHDVQTRLLAPDTILLEYHLGEERSYVWAISRDDVRVHVLPNEKTLETLVRDWHDLIRRNPLDLDDAAARDLRRRVSDGGHALARAVVQPVANDIRGKRLLIVPDGALHYAPFSALPDERGTLLLVNHEIAYLPSATVLDTLRRVPDRDRSGSIAVFADPVFQSDDARFSGDDPALAIIAKASPPPAQERRWAGSADLSRLLFTRFEAQAIAAAAGERLRLQALDFRAAKRTLIGSDLHGVDILHIATHAVIDAEAPELSGLVLSLYDEKGKRVDGIVGLNDIYNLDLDADLVVLSACRTALGKVVYGEGLIGLTRGFLYGGARRVAATVWSAHDRATARMMTHFYDAMLRNGDTPAAALRAAQLAMTRDRRWSDPYFWAAFTLHGD